MEMEHLGHKLAVSDDDARAIAMETQSLNHDGRSIDVYLDAGTGRLTFETREGNEGWQKRETLALIANYNGPTSFNDIMGSVEYEAKGIAKEELKNDRERLKGLIKELAESGKKEWKFENGVRVTNPELHIFRCFDEDGRYVGSVDLGDGEDVEYLSFIEDMEKGWDPVTGELDCLELGHPPAIAYAWKGEAHTISQEDITGVSCETVGIGDDDQYVQAYLNLRDGSLTWEEFVGPEGISWLEFHDPETILAGSFNGQNAPYTERQVSDAIRDKLERGLSESEFLKSEGLRLLGPDEAEALATPEGRQESGEQVEAAGARQPSGMTYEWKGETHKIRPEKIEELSFDTYLWLHRDVKGDSYIKAYLDLSDGSLTWERHEGAEPPSRPEPDNPGMVEAGTFLIGEAPYTERYITEIISSSLEESEYLKRAGFRLLDLGQPSEMGYRWRGSDRYISQGDIEDLWRDIKTQTSRYYTAYMDLADGTLTWSESDRREDLLEFDDPEKVFAGEFDSRRGYREYQVSEAIADALNDSEQLKDTDFRMLPPWGPSGAREEQETQDAKQQGATKRRR